MTASCGTASCGILKMPLNGLLMGHLPWIDNLRLYFLPGDLMIDFLMSFKVIFVLTYGGMGIFSMIALELVHV